MGIYELKINRWAEELPVQPYELNGRRIITIAEDSKGAILKFSKFAENEKIHNGGEIAAQRLQFNPERTYQRV